MTLEQAYRDECDRLRLLVEEFRQAGSEYIVRNQEAINAVVVSDWDEYVKPKAIPSILGFLTASLIIHCISLLEFRLPIIVVHSLRSAGRVIPSELQTFESGNIIAWMEKVVTRTKGAVFDFDDPLAERIKAWIRVRNDVAHYGGYRSKKTEQRQIEILVGVNVGEIGTLYGIQFAACENAINDIEAFFRKTHDSLARSENGQE